MHRNTMTTRRVVSILACDKPRLIAEVTAELGGVCREWVAKVQGRSDGQMKGREHAGMTCVLWHSTDTKSHRR